MNRDTYCDHLHSLSNADLRKECVARILAYRAAPSGSFDRRALRDVARLCWSECMDRKNPAIYAVALSDVRCEEAERLGSNRATKGGTP